MADTNCKCIYCMKEQDKKERICSLCGFRCYTLQSLDIDCLMRIDGVTKEKYEEIQIIKKKNEK
jgi:hypothetical protein